MYKEREEESGHISHIGFHINPYAFDSGEEKDLFRYLRDVLDEEETIKDVYFTGARVCVLTQVEMIFTLNTGVQSKSV